MEKELVSYEMALTLKELGFDEPCYDNYNIYGKLWGLRLNKQVKIKGACLAPTFSQAFRFFRDKFKLFSYVELHLNFPIRYYFIIYEIGNDDFVCHTEDKTIFYDKYKDAEIACLKLLIELVKNKSV